MFKLNFVIIFLLANLVLSAQANLKEGKVGYTSSQLVYVNFTNTDGIGEGDTLFVKSENKQLPALKVKYISSSSAACEKLNGDDFKSGMLVFALLKNSQQPIEDTPLVVTQTKPTISSH